MPIGTNNKCFTHCGLFKQIINFMLSLLFSNTSKQINELNSRLFKFIYILNWSNTIFVMFHSNTTINHNSIFTFIHQNTMCKIWTGRMMMEKSGDFSSFLYSPFRRTETNIKIKTGHVLLSSSQWHWHHGYANEDVWSGL